MAAFGRKPNIGEDVTAETDEGNRITCRIVEEIPGHEEHPYAGAFRCTEVEA